MIGPAVYENLWLWAGVLGPLVHRARPRPEGSAEHVALALQYVYVFAQRPLVPLPHTHYAKITVELKLAYLADWARRAEDFIKTCNAN